MNLKNANSSISQLVVEHRSYHVKVIVERRKNSRVSIVKSGVIIRISNYLSVSERESQIHKFVEWARKKIKAKPEIVPVEQYRNYDDGDALHVGAYIFHIEKKFSMRSRSYAKIAGNRIIMSIADGIAETEQRQHASKLVAKCLASFWKPIVMERILDLNTFHFKRLINKITIKNNSTNWGSCSSKGNINISVRLMWAPELVVDYVLIHELAHLIVPNHSKRFWDTVADAMPDYEQHEAWLKEYGSQCHF